jgi:hypothetical protein
MRLPRIVSQTQPTLADYMLVRGIEANCLAEQIKRPCRTVRSWISGERCPQTVRDLADGLGTTSDEVVNLLAATRDARNESLELRAIRTAFAACQFAESQPRQQQARKRFRKLAKLAKRLGKKPMRIFVNREPSAA